MAFIHYKRPSSIVFNTIQHNERGFPVVEAVHFFKKKHI